jgi:ribosome-binding ATPase YchF (GTP1/OBG family)
MFLKVAIVGLPNVGEVALFSNSTLFNAFNQNLS